MVNPIYQQDEELLLNQFGSKYLGAAAHTNVNSNEFIVQEDAVISVLTGGDSSIAANNVDYKASMSLSGVTLKQGALIVAPQGESFQSITIDSGTIMAYNSVVGGTKPGAVSLLLDLYPDAAAAYSLRKLRTDYTGPAIEARKTVGGVTSIQDIGFVNGELDTTSLLSFAEGGDVFVAKRYDQSGNGYDLEQVSQSAQPKIVNAGALYTFNGKPYFLTDGVDDVMRTTTNPIFGTDSRSLFFVQKTNVAGVTGRFNLAADTGVAGRAWLITPEIGARTVSTTWVSSTPTSITSPSLISNIYTSGNLHSGNSMWLDGVPVVRTSGNDGTIDTIDNNMTEGGNSTANFYNGYISESIIYKSDQSANREAIEDNINTHYTIY
jgi:hypothetical protein